MFIIEEDEKKRTEQRERALKLARFYKDEALYEESIKKYELYIFLSKSSGIVCDYTIYKEIAICYALKGHTAEAINYLRKAEELNDKEESIIYLLAQMYLQAGIDEKAKQYYYKILEIKGSSTSVYYQLGEIYYRENNFNEAIKCWEKVIELEPTNAYTHYLLGVIYFNKKEYDKSEKSFKASYENRYRSGMLYQYLGKVYSKLNDKENAKLNFLIALEKDNTNSQLYVEYLRELNDEEIKAEELKLKNSEGYTISEFRLGIFYKFIGKIKEAVEIFEDLLKTKLSANLKVALRTELDEIYSKGETE